jgi:pimeloyl-ACP methyl ester carboxylesterase
MRMTASHVDVPGGRLFVLDEGAGPPLILLHAAIADHRAWEPWSALAAAGYRVIRFDARGFGASTAEDVEFSPRDDVRTVMDALGSGERSSSATRVAGCSPSIPPSKRRSGSPRSSGWRPAWRLRRWIDSAEAGVEAEYERIDAAGDAAALTAFETDLGRRSAPAGRPGGRSDPGPGLRDEPAAQRSGMSRTGDPARASRPRPSGGAALPVLLVAGSLDFSDVETTARHVETEAPDVRVVIWPDVAP